MISSSPGRSVSVWLAVAVIGALLGHVGLTKLSADPPPPHAAGPFPMSARIGANIYLQTSAEYRACCRTIYTCAELRLDSSLRNAKPQPTRPAVVMDLDETVLDNSAFQTFLYNHHLEYTDKLWADYEQNDPQDVTLIPGAKHFIDRAESLGVNVVFISNRSDEYRTLTKSGAATLVGKRSDPPDRSPLPQEQRRQLGQIIPPRRGCRQIQRAHVLRRQSPRFLGCLCGGEASAESHAARVPGSDRRSAIGGRRCELPLGRGLVRDSKSCLRRMGEADRSRPRGNHALHQHEGKGSATKLMETIGGRESSRFAKWGQSPAVL